MLIFTSYLGFWKKYKVKMPPPILITAVKPEWWEGDWRPDLAPDQKDLWRYKDGSLPWEELKSNFEKKLEKVGAQKILESLPEECTLLCWEKKGIPCHRHVLAEFLTRQTKLAVLEYRVCASAYNPSGVPIWQRRPQ